MISKSLIVHLHTLWQIVILPWGFLIFPINDDLALCLGRVCALNCWSHRVVEIYRVCHSGRNSAHQWIILRCIYHIALAGQNIAWLGTSRLRLIISALSRATFVVFFWIVPEGWTCMAVQHHLCLSKRFGLREQLRSHILSLHHQRVTQTLHRLLHFDFACVFYPAYDLVPGMDLILEILTHLLSQRFLSCIAILVLRKAILDYFWGWTSCRVESLLVILKLIFSMNYLRFYINSW